MFLFNIWFLINFWRMILFLMLKDFWIEMRSLIFSVVFIQLLVVCDLFWIGKKV